MKAAIGGVGAALAASACCLGPVAFSLMGAGALGATAVALEPYRAPATPEAIRALK